MNYSVNIWLEMKKGIFRIKPGDVIDAQITSNSDWNRSILIVSSQLQSCDNEGDDEIEHGDVENHFWDVIEFYHSH